MRSPAEIRTNAREIAFVPSTHPRRRIGGEAYTALGKRDTCVVCLDEFDCTEPDSCARIGDGANDVTTATQLVRFLGELAGAEGSAVVMPCMHAMHAACLLEHVRKAPRRTNWIACPVCRANVVVDDRTSPDDPTPENPIDRRVREAIADWYARGGRVRVDGTDHETDRALAPLSRRLFEAIDHPDVRRVRSWPVPGSLGPFAWAIGWGVCCALDARVHETRVMAQVTPALFDAMRDRIRPDRSAIDGVDAHVWAAETAAVRNAVAHGPPSFRNAVHRAHRRAAKPVRDVRVAIARVSDAIGTIRDVPGLAESRRFRALARFVEYAPEFASRLPVDAGALVATGAFETLAPLTSCADDERRGWRAWVPWIRGRDVRGGGGGVRGGEWGRDGVTLTAAAVVASVAASVAVAVATV